MTPTALFDRTAALTAIDNVAERLVAMVTAATDTTIRVPDTPEWTVREAFAHVVTVAPRYINAARHEGEWVRQIDDLAGLNAREVAGLATTSTQVMADRLRGSLVELADVINGFADQQPVFQFHGGQKIQADVALGILLGELVIHGRDIARALHREWPVNPAYVELIMRGVTPILPGWLDADRARGHTGRYEVRLRGQGVHRFDFDRGRLRMNPPGPFRPDVVISAQPEAFLLVVYKRVSQWPGILSGRLTAYGRRPWRALTFAGLFHQP
jgi:uncharacterized protein (TIGR03083 family)